jgi:hypothetical protein
MTDRELMQMALDALEKHVLEYETAEALRARLAQPEPLPAKSKGALSHEENKQHNKKILDKFYEENAHLYTAPPQREWVGLTDDEATILFRLCLGKTYDHFWQAIEAKLKEKNSG